MAKYKIIDFHTHIFDTDVYNKCNHKAYCDMSKENTKRDLEKLGVVKVCGSIIGNRLETPDFSYIKHLNDKALELREYYDGFYVPGFHVHPSFVKESIDEIERMYKLGVKLIGELVPYLHAWSDYSCKEFSQILECAENYNMVVSVHSSTEYDEKSVKQMDEMVKNHPNVKFVGAHVCDGSLFNSHLKRLKENSNYYVDLSGGGLFKHGVLSHLVKECGADRVLFGSDYPICNPSMYVGGVTIEYLISEEDKQKILHDNAVKLLEL